MDFITRFLAELIEKFKAQNPRTFAVIALVLLTLIYSAQQGSFLGVWTLPEMAIKVINFVAPVLLALVGSQTFKFLSPASQERREELAGK